jgi:hypothetical protein
MDVNSTMSSFAADLCEECHGATDYERWFATTESYTIDYDTMYEPYTILPKESPFYDENLRGR